MKYKIFVSIVSYRDAMLENTVKSLLENQSGEHDICISVLDQSTTMFTITDPCIKYKQIEPKYANGVGWARHLNSLNLTNEDFYYQIDSHVIFDKDWDKFLIADYQLGVKTYNTDKVILSSSCKTFTKESNGSFLKHDVDNKYPIIVKYDPIGFIQNKLLIARGRYSSNHSNNTPIPAIHLQAGNLFTHADYIKNVGICPYIFFHFEEQHLTLNAFINGYKLLHHTSLYIYHLEYDHSTYETKPWINPQISQNQIDSFQLSSGNYWLSFLDSIPDNLLNKFYKYSGIDYINEFLDPSTMWKGIPTFLDTGMTLIPQSSISYSSVTGLKYLLFNTTDIITTLIRDQGQFRDEITTVAYEYLKDFVNPIVYDIGCNYGSFTIPLAAQLSSGVFFTFEVQKPIFNQLCASISLNQLSNISTYNVAVGNDINTIDVEMLDYYNSQNYGAFSLNKEVRTNNPQGNLYTTNIYKIQQIRLDDLQLPNPDLIKITVNGMELDVLLGASDIINRSKPIVLVSCWSNEFFKESKDKIIEIIKTYNYSISYKHEMLWCTPNHI